MKNIKVNPRVFCVVKDGASQPVEQENADFFEHQDRIAEERSRDAISKQIKQYGYGKVIYKFLMSHCKPKVLTQKALTKIRTSYQRLVCIMSRKDADSLLWPICMGHMDEALTEGIHLYKNKKSCAVQAWSDCFGSKATNYSTFITIDPLTKLEECNHIASSDQSVRYKISRRIHDGCFTIRHMGKLSKNPSGWSVIMQFLQQVCGKDFHEGVEVSVIVFDQEGEISKMLETQTRDIGKESKPQITKFEDGLLRGTLGASFMMDLVGERNRGRRQIMTVIFNRIHALELWNLDPSKELSLWSNTDYSNFLRMVGTNEIRLAGIGEKIEDRQQVFRVYVRDNKILVDRLGSYFNQEDTEVVHQAGLAIFGNSTSSSSSTSTSTTMLQEELCHTEIIGNDTDLFVASVLLINNHMHKLGVEMDSIGKLFVRRNLDPKSKNCGIICCNDFVSLIREQNNLQHLEKEMRVVEVVAVTIALGGDTTNSMYHMGQKKGMEVYLKHAPSFKGLVRRNHNDSDHHEFSLNFESFVELMKTWYVYRKPITFTNNWKGIIGNDEKERFIRGLDYTHMMYLTAQREIEELQWYMISFENLKFCVGRIDTRLNRWAMARIGVYVKNFRNKGIDVYLINGNIITQPIDMDIKLEEVKRVWPSVTRNAKGIPINGSCDVLYGTPDGAEFIMRQMTSRGKKVSKTKNNEPTIPQFGEQKMESQSDADQEEEENENVKARDKYLVGALGRVENEELKTNLLGAAGAEDVEAIVEHEMSATHDSD